MLLTIQNNKKFNDFRGVGKKFNNILRRIEDDIAELGKFIISIMIKEMDEEAYVYKLCTDQENEQYK